jgi:hypothetical protein
LDDLQHAGGKVRQQLSAKIHGKAGLSFENSDYPEATTIGTVTDQRDEDVWGFNAGLGWDPLRWFGLEANWDYESRDSNFAIYDYDAYELSLSATAHF